jgi:hypothetical protein
MILRLLLLFIPAGLLSAQSLTLDALVTPSTIVYHDEKPVPFALYGLVEFKTLQELFSYVDAQAGRWQFPNPGARNEFARSLLDRGVESRVISMVDEKPLEAILTHTREELDAAIDRLPAPLFEGRNWRLDALAYRRAFDRVRDRWSKGLNCWSASTSIAGRVLSNWYPIEEGLEFDGATYDSLEHLWQAIKYHPDVTTPEVMRLLDRLNNVDWESWFSGLDHDQKIYLEHAYIVEFLRANLTPSKTAWFREQLAAQPSQAKPRALQQRTPGRLRFTSLQEKVLWGDLADVFHLLVYLAPLAPVGDASLIAALQARHFDGIYLSDRKLGFISPEFQALMLELWKVKYLKMKRFSEVIRSIPREVKIEHYLNDGDSPDIPIPVYIGYLNQIREMAWAAAAH